MQWLFQFKKRYGLAILSYMITSNHIHLLIVDTGKRDVIPKSMKFVAGRTGQEYNQRNNRRGERKLSGKIAIMQRLSKAVSIWFDVLSITIRIWYALVQRARCHRLR